MSANDKIVLVSRRIVYGSTFYDPANDAAKMACELAQTRTVTVSMIAVMKRYGYTVRVVGTEEHDL